MAKKQKRRRHRHRRQQHRKSKALLGNATLDMKPLEQHLKPFTINHSRNFCIRFCGSVWRRCPFSLSFDSPFLACRIQIWNFTMEKLWTKVKVEVEMFYLAEMSSTKQNRKKMSAEQNGNGIFFSFVYFWMILRTLGWRWRWSSKPR